MLTITASFPERTVQMRDGRSLTYPAYTKQFTCRDDGGWESPGVLDKNMRAKDVHDACEMATNIREIEVTLIASQIKQEK